VCVDFDAFALHLSRYTCLFALPRGARDIESMMGYRLHVVTAPTTHALPSKVQGRTFTRRLFSPTHI
jgi:hypothetical protein